MMLRPRTANSKQWWQNIIRKLEDSKQMSSSLKDKDRFFHFKMYPNNSQTTLLKNWLPKRKKRNSPFTKHAEWVQRSKPHSQTETTSCHVKSTQILCLFDREMQTDSQIFQPKTVIKTRDTLVFNHKTPLQTENEKV